MSLARDKYPGTKPSFLSVNYFVQYRRASRQARARWADICFIDRCCFISRCQEQCCIHWTSMYGFDTRCKAFDVGQRLHKMLWWLLEYSKWVWVSTYRLKIRISRWLATYGIVVYNDQYVITPRTLNLGRQTGSCTLGKIVTKIVQELTFPIISVKITSRELYL